MLYLHPFIKASAFLTYVGPFDTVYRERLVSEWLEKVKAKELPFSSDFSFVHLLAQPVKVSWLVGW